MQDLHSVAKFLAEGEMDRGRVRLLNKLGYLEVTTVTSQ